MGNKILQQRGQWDSNLDYLIVTIGSVVGLGNIIQFPFFVAKYGSLFILFFLLFELFISIPVILAEFFIGRRSKQNPVGAFSVLAMESGANYRWRWIGWICFIILILTLGYYSVSVSTILSSFIETLGRLSTRSNEYALLQTHTTNLILHTIYFVIFLVMTMAVIARGINRGLEKISRIVVPLFFILFFVLALYASMVGNFHNALRYLLQFKGHVSAELLLSALTYAFFKLNTAMGCMIVYGSYIPATTRLGRSTLIIAGFDLIASLLSYFIIFPILFSHVQFSSSLPQVDLVVVSQNFSLIPGGAWMIAFFLLGTVFASWMPAIAFAESATVTLIERAYFKRSTATILIGLIAFIIGGIIFFTTGMLPKQWTMSGIIQELAGEFLTPISALLIALFAGWIIKKSVASTELDFGKGLFSIWRFLIRFVVPICLIVMFIYLLWV